MSRSKETGKRDKRSNNLGTIKQRKDGRWEGQYCCGKDDKGKLVRKSIYGKSKPEVEKKLAAITTDQDRGEFIPPDKITYKEWLTIWQNDYLGSVKGSTVTNYKYHINENIIPALGGIKLQKLTAPMIQKLYKCKEGKLSPKTIKNLHGVIHKSLEQAVKVGYIRTNVSDACILPRIVKKEMIILQGEQYKAFLREIKGKANEEIFFVDLFTGLREGEIIGLSWDCVDFKKQTIKVERQLKRKGNGNTKNHYEFDTLKNDKTRIVKPASVVFDVLKKVRAKQRKNKMKYGENFKNPDNLVFTDELGNHIGAECLLKCFKVRVKHIGLPEMRFHDLRHTWVATQLQNGVNVKTVSEMAGHATVAFTLDVYGHVTDTMRDDAAEKMQQFYNAL